jgi:hypothetical protein
MSRDLSNLVQKSRILHLKKPLDAKALFRPVIYGHARVSTDGQSG